ncbi:DNA-3-methyladenine glycosidase [Pyrococcus sp. NA2]|uniref:DNA-3-methyladenine glycosylase family protein n=1 Tax=Pyrococcus sp. (strain NA2) TaxID=342949 RepID=UPI000209AF20|nr:DNA-3-methyladenine glycosylase [Pyrococcus sp. NA2]AEC52338.1 DNA-3-methyladenine glycosidase [Pyrococcus sp. NA2]
MISLEKTTNEMIKNGTWRYKDGIFWQALPFGIVGFDGNDFIIPDELSRREKKIAKDKIKFILGLDTDLDSFYSEISDSRFSFLIDEFYGLTIPAAPNVYQAIVEVIAQQQVSFEFAQKTIFNLVRLINRRVKDLYLFPNPEDVLNLGEKIKEAKLGYRANYILSITREYLNGKFENIEKMDDEEAIRYLTKFRGVGKWSAELFLMYGLRRNVYPAGDLGLRRGIAKIFGLNPKEVKERQVREIIEPYGKWKSLLAFYILCYDRKTEGMRR